MGQRTTLDDLRAVMAALRTPGSGCPWDLEQSFETIAPYTLEEAYEVADAIERGQRDALKEELGDLLFQVVYHARLAEEEGAFDLDDVVAAITEKMIRRHPHVFGDAAARDVRDVDAIWRRAKEAERRARDGAMMPTEGRQAAAGANTVANAVDQARDARRTRQAQSGNPFEGIARALPALMRAQKLQKRASEWGLDWADAREVLAVVREELGELEHAIDEGGPADIAHEVGDLLFAVANLARHLGTDAEAALRAASGRFERRVGHLIGALEAEGRAIEDCDEATLDALWAAAKSAESEDEAEEM